jgi:hypothetical protein
MLKLNTKLLPIAALILMVLALLMLATPLLTPQTEFGMNGSGTNRPFAFQGTPAPGLTFPSGDTGQSTTGQVFVFQGTPPAGITDGTNQIQGFPQTTTGRQFQSGGVFSLLRLGFLNGRTGTIVYAIALLVSLIAAVGMFMTKLWGKILGIVMAVLYLILAIISLLPNILMQFASQAGNFSNIILTSVHVVLAIAMIVFAVIPPKKAVAPVVAPPAA